MVEKLFVLGRDKDLSLLELESVFSAESILKVKGGFAIVETDKDFSIGRFGGITKIGRKIRDFDEVVFDKGKLNYSFFGGDNLLLQLKKRFKEERVKASFRKFSYEPGNLDLELIQFDNKLFVIEQVSNPRKYKLRDENRPRFDAKKVVSIRLAKMLINFSKAEKEILDMFCGNGTILQEGLLNGLNVIGVDRNIHEAKENLKWFKRGFNIQNNFKLIEGDARRLHSFVQRAECVVTEPYMGPYFKRLPSMSKGKRVIRSLAELYDGLFRELQLVVEKRVVMVIPSIRTYKKTLEIDFSSIAEKHGFKMVESKVKLPVSYNNPQAKVLREIWILENKGALHPANQPSATLKGKEKT